MAHWAMDYQFPFQTITLAEARRRWQQLRNNRHLAISGRNLSSQELPQLLYLICVNRTTVHRYAQIAECFNQPEQIKARRLDSISALQCWQEHPSWSFEQIMGAIKRPTGFPPTVMMAMFKLFKPKVVVDPCGGWGDRLVGALAYCDQLVSYTSIEPNKRLVRSYEQMVNKLVGKDQSKRFNFIQGCAEEQLVCLPKGTADLVFTSPPYYNLELYNSEPTQSTARYPKYLDWLENFLFKLMDGSVQVLKPEGVLAINIQDVPGASIQSDLLDYMACHIHMRYLGKIYFGDHQKPREIYGEILIWKGNGTPP